MTFDTEGQTVAIIGLDAVRTEESFGDVGPWTTGVGLSAEVRQVVSETHSLGVSSRSAKNRLPAESNPDGSPGERRE